MFRDKALVLLEIINHGITEWFWLEKPSRTSESTIPPALPRSPLTPVPKGHLSVSFRNLRGWGLTAEDHATKFCRKTNWRKFTQFFRRNWAPPILWTQTAPPQSSPVFYVGRTVQVKISFSSLKLSCSYAMARGRNTEAWSLFGISPQEVLWWVGSNSSLNWVGIDQYPKDEQSLTAHG